MWRPLAFERDTQAATPAGQMHLNSELNDLMGAETARPRQLGCLN